MREGHPDPRIEPLVAKVRSLFIYWQEENELHLHDYKFSVETRMQIFHEHVRRYLYQRITRDDTRDVLSPDIANFFLNPFRITRYYKTISRDDMVRAVSSFDQLEQTIKDSLLECIHLERELEQLGKFDFTIQYDSIGYNWLRKIYKPQSDLEDRLHLVNNEMMRCVYLIEATVRNIEKENGLLPELLDLRRMPLKVTSQGENYLETVAPTEEEIVSWKNEVTSKFLLSHNERIVELGQELNLLEEKLAAYEQEGKEIQEQLTLMVATIEQEKEVRIQYGDKKRRLKDVSAGVEILQRVYDDATAIMDLGDLLAQFDLQTPTGQYETTYDQRQYSDVEREVANNLSRLSLYTAQCSLTQGHDVVEYTIETLPQVAPGVVGIARAERIREKSRRHDGQSGEDEIGLPVAPPPDAPGTPSQPLSDDDTEEYEDDDGG